MPFEPHIVRDETTPSSTPQPVWDDAETLELSDDMALIAERLTDDAAYLHGRFPPGATPPEPQRNPASKPRHTWQWISVGGAVVAVVGVLVIAVVWNWPGGAVHEPGHVTVNQPKLPADGVAIGDFTSKRAAGSRVAATSRGGEVKEVAIEAGAVEWEESYEPPATFLRNVSGPELEGVLDLLEVEEAEISI